MHNYPIADLLARMGRLLEIKGENVFKVRAYEKAAENIRACSEDLEMLRREGRLNEVGGLGKALQEKIGEFIDTGRVSAYDRLTEEIPESVLEMVDIPSVGPKKAKLFFERLKLHSLDDLERAARAGKLAGLPGIQAKTITNILKGIETVRSGQERMNLGTALEIADVFVRSLKKLKQVKAIEVAGSLRRMKEQIRDIDILIVADNPQPVMEAFVRHPEVKQINAYGSTKSSVLTQEHVQVDLRVVEENSFGAALLYFTGSKNFNIKLRQLAATRKQRVNEYGIFALKRKSEKRLAGRTEKECFDVLGLPFIPPELREDLGEKRLFGPGRPQIPRLVQLKDVRGDGHVHSRWSDGENSIAELVQAARQRSYDYIVISDHSVSLRIAQGLPAAEVEKKKKEINSLNRRQKNVRILFGAEVEIDKQGCLDYNERILKAFDLVIGAVHSGFEIGRESMTRRLVAACRHPYVDVIAHPLCRHIGKRDFLDVDFDLICRTAAETGTLLEINAFPVRLDLDSAHVYFAKTQGVRFMINTDAHQIKHLDFMQLGVGLARRGWLTKNDVVNTYPLSGFNKCLKRNQNKS